MSDYVPCLLNYNNFVLTYIAPYLRETNVDIKRLTAADTNFVKEYKARGGVCVCVCVRERERE
jgi:hypothetical protein